MFSGFMANAWEVATLVAVVAGVVGFFVVLRGAAFPAHAIPQGAFAGAAGASLIGVSTLLGLGVFAFLAALGIGWLGRRGRADVVTALALVMMLALGAAFLSQSTQYEPEIFSLLFGEILGVTANEILPVALLGLVCVLAVAVLYRPLMLTSIAPDIAAARGIRPHGDGVPRRGRLRHHHDGARCRCAAHLHSHDRPSGRRPLFQRPSLGRPALVGGDRARHGLGGHRLLLPVQLAGGVLRGHAQRRLVRRRTRLRHGAPQRGVRHRDTPRRSAVDRWVRAPPVGSAMGRVPAFPSTFAPGALTDLMIRKW
jgi:hypothetical protein